MSDTNSSGCLPMLALAGLGVWLYFNGMPEWTKKYTYRAEVGYYEGSERTWYVGQDKNYQACIDEATAYYRSLNDKRPNRAFSWACRKMEGEKFLDRVR